MANKKNNANDFFSSMPFWGWADGNGKDQWEEFKASMEKLWKQQQEMQKAAEKAWKEQWERTVCTSTFQTNRVQTAQNAMAV